MISRLASSLIRTSLRRAMSTTQKPIFLYTAATPNGKPVTVLLEELKAAYGVNKIDYESVPSSTYHRPC